MNDDIREELNRLRGLCVIHAAEIETLFLLLTSLYRRLALTPSQKEDISHTYVRMRKEAGQRMLLGIEDKNPELAAQIQAMLDDSCKNFPI